MNRGWVGEEKETVREGMEELRRVRGRDRDRLPPSTFSFGDGDTTCGVTIYETVTPLRP